MYQYEYVLKEEYLPARNEIQALIHLVQKRVKRHFTFYYQFTETTSQSMITRDFSTNTGYDFEVLFSINNYNNLPPQRIRNILMWGFCKYSDKFQCEPAEDRKRVITIRFASPDGSHPEILHSCDFAVVTDCTYANGCPYQKLIYFNRKKNIYEWHRKPDALYVLPDKVKWLKEKDLWTDVKNTYLNKKNRNENPHKKSRSIFVEAVNEVYYGNGGPYIEHARAPRPTPLSPDR